MILVLYGPDTYRSRKKLNEIIAEYRNKAGSNLNFYRFDTEEDRPEDIKRALESGSLFESKKLVVIERAFSSGETFPQIKSSVESVKQSSDTILVLWDAALDDAARKRLKEIQGTGVKAQEFKILSPRELKKWIEDEARARGAALTPEGFLRLAQHGADLWRMENELDKIALRDVRHTQRSSFAAGEAPTIFYLGDSFFTSRLRALGALFHLLDSGQDELSTFFYLSNHARNLFLVKSCEERGKSIPKSIAPHPFVVKRALAITRTIPVQDLQNRLKRFFEEDFKIKIGQLKPKESLIHMLFR